MPSIKAYLNGEYCLAHSFWFGLVLGGVIFSHIASMLQAVVWRLYDSDAIISAVIVQFVVIALFLIIMALAVGVLFAAFHNRSPMIRGWVACAIACFVLLGGLISIIESTTSIRTDGQSYGWPFGRDYRQFAHRGDFAFCLDRLLDNGQLTSIGVQIVTQLGARSDASLRLPESDNATHLAKDNAIMRQICCHVPISKHRKISHAIITVTNANNDNRTLIIAPDSCDALTR